MAEDRTRQTAAYIPPALHPGPRHPPGPARARSLWLGTQPEQGLSVTRTYPGWSGLKVVATASRTGTGRDQPRCAVVGLSGVIHGPHPMLPFGDIPHRFATTLYKGAVAGVRESALMSFPTRVTMNTPATPSCYCVSRQKRDALCVLLHRQGCSLAPSSRA